MAKKPEGKNEKESDNEKIKMQKNYAWYAWYTHDNKSSRKENEKRGKSTVIERKHAKTFGNKHSLQGGRRVVVYSEKT